MFHRFLSYNFSYQNFPIKAENLDQALAQQAQAHVYPPRDAKPNRLSQWTRHRNTSSSVFCCTWKLKKVIQNEKHWSLGAGKKWACRWWSGEALTVGLQHAEGALGGSQAWKMAVINGHVKCCEDLEWRSMKSENTRGGLLNTRIWSERAVGMRWNITMEAGEITSVVMSTCCSSGGPHGCSAPHGCS